MSDFFEIPGNGCISHQFFPEEACAECTRAMAFFNSDTESDIVNKVEHLSSHMRPNDQLARSAFMYPPPPPMTEEEEEGRLATAEREYHPESLAFEPFEGSPFHPVPLHKDDDHYYPERLALESHEGGPRKRGRPAKQSRNPLIRHNEIWDDDDTIIVDVGEEPAEGRSGLPKALKRFGARKPTSRRSKNPLIHENRAIEEVSSDESTEELSELPRALKRSEAREATIRRAKNPLNCQKTATEEASSSSDDTVVADVKDDSTEELAELRNALKRSEAKLKVAKEKTKLLAELKKLEDELAAEKDHQDKTTSLTNSVKSSRKRKAESEPEDFAKNEMTTGFQSRAKRVRKQEVKSEPDSAEEMTTSKRLAKRGRGRERKAESKVKSEPDSAEEMSTFKSLAKRGRKRKAESEPEDAPESRLRPRRSICNYAD